MAIVGYGNSMVEYVDYVSIVSINTRLPAHLIVISFTASIIFLFPLLIFFFFLFLLPFTTLPLTITTTVTSTAVVTTVPC